jgi:hypothetical protein
VITVQPIGQSVDLGAPATFQLAATGSMPLTFQWYFNGTPLSAATNASLTLTEVDATQAGTYEAVVSNDVGVATSQPATLTVTGMDSDGDGTTDSWMMQYFGHATGSVADSSRAQDDADGDGLSNLQEFLAGTSPIDPQSCLKLQVLGLELGTGQLQLSFAAVAGIAYTLEYSDNAVAGLWHKLTDVPAEPTTRMVILNDPSVASESPRLYRLVTPIQP